MVNCHTAWTGGALLGIGVNHHTASVEVRERLALDVKCWRERTPSIPNLLLSTCNRTEVYAWHDTARASRVRSQLSSALADAAGLPIKALAPHLFVKRRLDAIVHVVRVASGLDSLVVGEEQILGQIRAALRTARERGDAVAPLEGIFSRAVEAGRRVRGATMLGRQPSLASAAVEVARRTPELAEDGLAGRQAIVLGAGPMAKSAAQALLAAQAEVVIVNRTPIHAERVALELGQRVRVESFEHLPRLLAESRLVVAATGARHPVLDAPTVREAVVGRGAASMVVLDVALPRNVEPAVRAIPHVRLIDLDDLERMCPIDMAVRQAAIARAEALAIQEAQAIGRWLRIRASAPTIAGLRERGHAIRSFELRRAAPHLAGLTPDQYQAIDQLTEALVNKLLHGPTVALREAAAEPLPSRASRRVLDVVGLDLRLAT